MSDDTANDLSLCAFVPDYRTFLNDFAKIIDFIDWYANRE